MTTSCMLDLLVRTYLEVLSQATPQNKKITFPPGISIQDHGCPGKFALQKTFFVCFMHCVEGNLLCSLSLLSYSKFTKNKLGGTRPNERTH